MDGLAAVRLGQQQAPGIASPKRSSLWMEYWAVSAMSSGDIFMAYRAIDAHCTLMATLPKHNMIFVAYW